MIIDFHAHFVDPGVMRESAPHWILSGFGTRPFEPPPPDSPRARQTAKMMDPRPQLSDLEAGTVDVHVLLASTVVQGTAWAEPQHQAQLEQRTNDTCARWVATAPDKFVGSFTVPLRDDGLALRELERATSELGLCVVNVPAQVDGDYLGAPRFRPMWRRLAELGVVAFIHPDGIRDPWFQQYSLWNSVGQPIEEAKVMASLILEGVFDELDDLRIVISHGGGYLPHYFGRLDRNVTNMPESVRNIARLPSDYLRRFHYDTCVYDVSILQALAERVGTDRIVLGSDYPVGDDDHVGFVRRAGFGPTELEAILGGNATSLLALGSPS